MKTKKFTIMFLTGLLILTTQVGCGSNTSSTSTATSAYQCYTTAGTAVTNSYCSSTTGYYCEYGTSVVANTYCTSTTTTTTTATYQCYTTAGAAVTNSYCGSTTGYYCSYNGTTVANSYCYSSTTTTSTGSVCVGYYYFAGGYVYTGAYYPAGDYYCDPTSTYYNNCTGVTMTSLTTGITQLCQ